jgi:CBS domain containing-hemolysin-like protein
MAVDMHAISFAGSRGHMAFVQKVNDEGPGDPYYETIGVVTMEDVLEELLQADILDETDGKSNKKEFTSRLCSEYGLHLTSSRKVPGTTPA